MDINPEIDSLRNLLAESRRVLVTSHISPDPDSVSSVLLLGTTLMANYPGKDILMSLEEPAQELRILTGYELIKFQTLKTAYDAFRPSMIIIVDAVNLDRCSREDGAGVSSAARSEGIKIAIIDHHEPVNVEPGAVYVNQGSPAAVQDVYEVCFEGLKLKKPRGYAQTTMLGLYSDSGGFTYDNPRHQQTFKLVNELLDAGVSLETIASRLKSYSLLCVKTLGELAANTSVFQDYSYSYISDAFMAAHALGDSDFDDIRMAVGLFANDFVRNIGGRTQGFVVYKDIRGGANIYSVSLRAVSGARDVSLVAKRLGGGGHKPAAGAKFKAASIDEAVTNVKTGISHN